MCQPGQGTALGCGYHPLTVKMRRYLYIRPGISVMLEGLFGLGAAFFLLILVAALIRGDLESASIAAIAIPLFALFFALSWRAMRVPVSSRGVHLRPEPLAGLFRRWQPLAWTDIAGFEREQPTPRGAMAVRIVARKLDGDTAIVCAVPSHALDTPAQMDRSVERVLQQLEDERRLRLQDRQATAGRPRSADTEQ